ncbi:thermonuclease family protein [Porphyrobacter sp. AAP82]|uniref:thermonuclease family protein n=1 Tax=Porphyrobacter sp. AAP82 TaxID=1248917 RepID=UPI0002E93155|nr:thermonuclease family protein [Porphyrobacter sp. AAP82]
MTRPDPLLRRAAALAFVPLAAAAAAGLWPQAGEAQGQREQHAALFPVCGGPVRVTCVVDGDTFWLRGTKIRIADIDTPEVSQPACPEEHALGLAATERLRELLGAGRFGLAVPPDGRTRDRYGRELRIVTRGGKSLGSVLVREGLAARWGGPRKAWCRA